MAEWEDLSSKALHERNTYLSFQHSHIGITPDEKVEKWGSLSMQHIDGYL